jgi:AAA domain-containing protein
VCCRWLDAFWIREANVTDRFEEVARSWVQHRGEWWREHRPKKENGPDPDAAPPLTLAEWLARDLPEPDRLLGDLLTTTSRVLIVGPTGLGKTMFGLAVAMVLVTNKAFLHWKAGRKCRVLYVDGEMSARLMKRRCEKQQIEALLPPPTWIISASYPRKITKTCCR